MIELQDISTFFRQFWGLWLMVFFIGIIVWTYRPRNRERFLDDGNGMSPLKDNDTEKQKNGGKT